MFFLLHRPYKAVGTFRVRPDTSSIVIDSLIGAKSITLYLMWRVGGCFHKKISIFY